MMFLFCVLPLILDEVLNKPTIGPDNEKQCSCSSPVEQIVVQAKFFKQEAIKG